MHVGQIFLGQLLENTDQTQTLEPVSFGADSTDQKDLNVESIKPKL